MIIINEKSTLVIRLGFKDGSALEVVPTTGRYRIDDVTSDAQILDWTDFTPAAATHDLTITSAQNAIVNSALESEKKLVTVDVTYGTDSKRITGDYTYGVKNLAKIT